jgi:hypothetical protein
VYSDSIVAVVDGSGVVRTRASGTATINVAAVANAAIHTPIILRVEALPIPSPRRVTLWSADSLLVVGATARIDAIVWAVKYTLDQYGRLIPFDAPYQDQTVVWSIRNPTGAVMDSTTGHASGTRACVRAVAPGTITVVGTSVASGRVDSVRIRAVAVTLPVAVRVPANGYMVAGASWRVTSTVVSAAGNTDGVNQATTVASLDTNVVTIAADGTIVARSPGSTSLTFTSAAAPNVTAAMPVQVTTGVAFRQLAVGYAQEVCGRTAEGHVFCWGNNTYGELGEGSQIARRALRSP